MEFHKIQPRDIIAASNTKLKRILKCTVGIIIFLGLALLALILFISIYIPKLDA